MQSFLKIVILGAVYLAGFTPVSAQVMVGFSQNQASLTLAFDIYGNAQTVEPRTGVPLTYSHKGVLYAALEGEHGYVRVAPLMEKGIPEARIERMGDGPVVQGFPTVNWRLSVNRQPCGQIFASMQLAKVLNFNVTDISRLNLAMGLLLSDDLAADPCTYYDMPRALGNLVGFPLVVEGRDGTTQVTDIRHGDKALYDMPPKPLQKSLADEHRVLLLLAQLPQATRATYLATRRSELSPASEVLALKRLLRTSQQ